MMRYQFFCMLLSISLLYGESSVSPPGSVIIDHKNDAPGESINMDIAIADDLDQHPLAAQIRQMNAQTELVQRIKNQGMTHAQDLSNPSSQSIRFLNQNGRMYALPQGETDSSVPQTHSPVLYADTLRLTFTARTLPAMALIKIEDAYWLFFDKRYTMGMPKHLPHGVKDIRDYSTDLNTIFKINLDPESWPQIRIQTRAIHPQNQNSQTQIKEPLKVSPVQEFILECTEYPLLQRQKRMITWPSTLGGSVKILLPLASKEITWHHPELQQTFMIYTSKRYEGTFTPQEHFPHFSIAESYIGLALHPHSDSLVMMKDGEDLNLYDARGLSGNQERFTYPKDTLFFYDTRPPHIIHAELQSLQKHEQTSHTIMREIKLSIFLGLLSDASLLLKKLENLDIDQEQERDFMIMAVLTLSPGNELSDLPKRYLNHMTQSPEFAFWRNLYEHRPQNYAALVEPILSKYPIFLRNKIAEILLQLPDSYENLKKLIQVPGLNADLLERARLKLALMPPFDLRELDDLKAHALQRDIQARAAFQLILEQKKEWKRFEHTGKYDVERRIQDQKQAIQDLENYLLSFGPQMFQAKMLLAQLYREQKNYIRAMHILRDTRHSDPDRFEDVQRAMQRVFNFFFDDLGSPMLFTKLKQNLCPVTPMPRFFKVPTQPAQIHPHALEVIGFYNDFKEFTPNGSYGLLSTEHVATRLFDLSLYDESLELLSKRLESFLETHTTQDATHNILKLRIMIIILSILKGDTERAYTHLTELGNTNDDDIINFHRCLSVNLYSQEKKNDEALSLLKGRSDVQSLILRAQIYWKSQDWTHLQQLIPYMLKYLDPIDASERVRLVMRLVIARAMNPLTRKDEIKIPVGAEPEFEAQLAAQSPLNENDLRQLYEKIMKDTPFYARFLALTTPDLAIYDGLRHFASLKPLLDEGWLSDQTTL